MILSVIICFNINLLSARIPVVESIEVSTSGTDTILNININHPESISNPSADHVDLVEINIDGTIHTLDIIDPGTPVFIVQYNMGAVTGTRTVLARAYCNAGQWGEYCAPIVVPEFQLIHLFPILMAISIVGLLLKSKIYSQNDEIIKK